jgi:polyhydroxybutyrate depolymerase
MIRAILSAVLIVPALAATTPVPQTIQTKDGPRAYLLLKPESRGPLPLVILLHGHGGSAKQALTVGPLAAWAAISAREGVMVASLDGVKGPDGQKGWNDCRSHAAGNPPTDDVAFVKAVIQRLEREAGADPARVYIMGMSNGAMMTLRLGLQLDPAPAAFCAVCGLMADGGLCDPPAPRAVPALLIDGTEDPLVPFEGGQVHFFKKQRGAVISADRTVDFWRDADGLSEVKPVVWEFPHREASDPTRATKSVWSGAGGEQVEFIRIQGGGHAEPTLDHPYGAIYRAFTGKQNRDFESAEEAWAFFKDKKSK